MNEDLESVRFVMRCVVVLTLTATLLEMRLRRYRAARRAVSPVVSLPSEWTRLGRGGGER